MQQSNFQQYATQMTVAEHDKKAKKAKRLFRVGVVGAAVVATQIPVIAELITVVASVLVPETEATGIGLGFLLAWRGGKFFDQWYDNNHPAPVAQVSTSATAPPRPTSSPQILPPPRRGQP